MFKCSIVAFAYLFRTLLAFAKIEQLYMGTGIEIDEIKFGEIAWNKRLLNGTFRRRDNVSFMKCVTECMTRKRCESISYCRGRLQCNLQELNNMSDLTEDRDYVFSHIITWPKLWIGPCRWLNCSHNQKCSVEMGVPHCVISECQDLPLLENATIDAGYRGVNEVRSYVCDEGYTSDWGTTMTCGKDGHWHYHSPPCRVVSCPEPEYIPHTFRDIGGTTYGSTVEYTCTDGYQSTPPSTTSTCTATGEWHDVSLDCRETCALQNGYEYNAPTDMCFKFFMFEISHENAKGVCERDGGSLLRVDSEMKNNVITNYLANTNVGRLIHIQGTDTAREGNWQYDNGDAFSYTNWKNFVLDEPNGGPKENYLSYQIHLFATSYEFKWYDINDRELGNCLCGKT